MRQTTPRVILALVLGLGTLALGAPPVARARGADAVGSSCGGRVAVRGADMSAGGKFEVQRALRVGSHTVQLTETLADEVAQARGLIPANLLTNYAVSSVLFHPLAAGSGITVTLNPAITLDPPQTYANALLTAGVTDAEVGIAAPTSQPAYGTTALLGLLRTARYACVTINPIRERLAIREVVLTSRLAQTFGQGAGRLAAPNLLSALKADAVSRRLTALPTLEALIASGAVAQGMTVPTVQRPVLAQFLADLVASGAYASIVGRHPQITTISPREIALHLAAPTGGVPTSPAPTGSTGSSAHPASTIAHGTVVSASDTVVSVHQSDGTFAYNPAASMVVYRNGQPSTLGALQQGDAITVTTNAGHAATLIDATGRTAAVAPAVKAPAAPAAPSLNGTAIALLAALLLLALLAAPLLVGLLRRRREGRTVRTVTTTTTRGRTAASPGASRPGAPRRIAKRPTQSTTFAPRPNGPIAREDDEQ